VLEILRQRHVSVLPSFLESIKKRSAKSWRPGRRLAG
jgi:hypothetical protein